MGHFNQNLCPGSWLREESEKCARKYLLVRKYLLSTVSAAAVLAVVSCRLPSWVWLISRLVGNYKICFVSPLSTKPETGTSCGGEGRCSIMSRYISSMQISIFQISARWISILQIVASQLSILQIFIPQISIYISFFVDTPCADILLRYSRYMLRKYLFCSLAILDIYSIKKLQIFIDILLHIP